MSKEDKALQRTAQASMATAHPKLETVVIRLDYNNLVLSVSTYKQRGITLTIEMHGKGEGTSQRMTASKHDLKYQEALNAIQQTVPGIVLPLWFKAAMMSFSLVDSQNRSNY